MPRAFPLQKKAPKRETKTREALAARQSPLHAGSAAGAKPVPAGKRLPDGDRAIGPEERPVLPGFVEELGPEGRATLVEILDASGRPFLCMTPENALRQSLRPRMAAVALRDGLRRILLHRRADVRLGKTGRWDLRTGFVMAGETPEDAAERLLREAVPGLFPYAPPSVPDLAPAAEGEDGLAGRLSLFVSDLPPGVLPAPGDSDLLVVDEDELGGLARGAADLLTPELVWAVGTGRLFS